MRTQLRIVSGSLRGRRLVYTAHPGLRPMPDMVRQALFNMLGDAIPGRPFYDLFAGTGAVGIEALSRGARNAQFVERDPRVAREIARHLQAFGIADGNLVHRSDVYRWLERWQAPPEPVNVFLGPPYRELESHADNMMRAIDAVQTKAVVMSIVILQSDKGFDPGRLPQAASWDHRTYGRNRLSIWVKNIIPSNASGPNPAPPATRP